MESFSVIFSIGVLWAAESRSLCCLRPVMACSYPVRGFAGVVCGCVCLFFSSFSPVRIPFWVFCWFVLLRGPRVGVFPFLSAEVQGLEHRRGVSSKWAHWQHTLWWVSSPWSGHREAGALHSQNQCDALSSYL